MPQVPVTQGNSVQIAARQVGAVRAVEMDNGLGAGLVNAGGAIFQAGEDEARIQAVYDDAATKKLDVEVADRVRESLWTGDDAYFNKQGFDAQEARPQIEEQLKKLREEMMGKARNERQRTMLAGVLDKRIGDNLTDIARYATGQLNVELEKQTTSRLSGFQQDAVRQFDNPERYADNIAGGLAELESFADQQGWSDDRLDDEEQRFVSGVHTASITGRLTSDDIDGALALFDKYRDDMAYGDVQAIEAKLQPAIQYRQAEDDALVALGTVPTVGPDDAPTPGTSASLSTQLKAIESNESGGKQFSASGKPLTSSAGAIGVMQVMPGTAPEAARMAGLAWDPKRYREDENYNRALGQAYYKEMLRKFGGDPVKAAAAYNAGPGSARRGTGVMGAMAKARKAGEPDNWVAYLPAETRDYVAKFQRKTGSTGGAEGSAPRKWDLSAAYTTLEDRAKKEGWTPERLERARQRVDERVKRDEMLENRQSASEYEAAIDRVDQLGDSFTDVSQIPNYDRLDPKQRMELRDIAKRNAAPTPVEANGDIAVALDIMAIEQPEKFLQQDLRVYRSQMTAGEHASLQRKAAMIRAKPDEEAVFRGGISGTISMFASPEMNLSGKKNAQRKAKVMGIMETWLRSYVKPGVQPTQGQYMEALRFATGSIEKPQGGIKGAIFGGTKEIPRTDLPVFDVPPDVLQAIIRAYRAETGKRPTDQQIVQIYEKNKGRY